LSDWATGPAWQRIPPLLPGGVPETTLLRRETMRDSVWNQVVGKAFDRGLTLCGTRLADGA
jgi:hypothetical protein